MEIVYAIPLSVSLKIMEEVFDNPYLTEHVFFPVHKGIQEGEELDLALKKCPHVPPVLASLVTVGIETGEMADSLYKAANIYELEIDQMVQKLLSLLEPVIVSMLGFFVLFVILSIFLPLYQSISALGA